MKYRKIPAKEFHRIYHIVPRAVVDLVIRSNEKGILLSKRAITPFEGKWHTPGGTILFKEPLKHAVERVAKEELGVEVKIEKHLGVAECLNDGGRHTISNVFLVRMISGKLRTDAQSKGFKFFKKIPQNFIPYQKKFLQEKFSEIMNGD